MGKLINYLENEMKAQELFEKAKKIAYEKQVPTDDILNPMLIEMVLGGNIRTQTMRIANGYSLLKY
jgi:hypothetical protein